MKLYLIKLLRPVIAHYKWRVVEYYEFETEADAVEYYERREKEV